MFDIILQLSSDLNMRALRTSASNEGTHNFVQFKINRPSAFNEFICRADISINGENNYLLVENDSFLLPRSLTKAGELIIQLVYIRPDGDIVAKTNIVTLIIGNSINAVNEADTSFKDGLAQLAANSFTSVDYIDNTLSFTNINGDIRDEVTITSTSGGDGTNDHSQLINRDADNSHPASAIAFADGNLETIVTNHDNRIATNETNITAIQSENTAKWVLLNDVDNRSRNNAIAISTIEETINSTSVRTLIKEIELEESVYSINIDLDDIVDNNIQVFVRGKNASTTVTYYVSFNEDRGFEVTTDHFYISSGNVFASTGIRNVMSSGTFISILDMRKAKDIFIGINSFAYPNITTTGNASYSKEGLEGINSVQITSTNVDYTIPQGTVVQIYSNL